MSSACVECFLNIASFRGARLTAVDVLDQILASSGSEDLDKSNTVSEDEDDEVSFNFN